MSPVVQETYAFAYMVPNVKHKGVVMWGGKNMFLSQKFSFSCYPFHLPPMPPSHHSYTLWVLCLSCVCLLLDPRCFQWSLHCPFLLFHWFCIILLDAWYDNFSWFCFLVQTSSFSECFFKWSHMVLQWNFVTTLHCGLFFHCQELGWPRVNL